MVPGFFTDDARLMAFEKLDSFCKKINGPRSLPFTALFYLHINGAQGGFISFKPHPMAQIFLAWGA